MMKSFLRNKPNPVYPDKQNSQSNLFQNIQRKLRLSQKQGNFKKKKERDPFVDRVNGYIETISSQNKPSRRSSKPSKNNYPSLRESRSKIRDTKPSNASSKEVTASLSKRIKTEKDINKNLQKCIIQIQKILWERNERLEILEQELNYQNLIGKKSYESEEQSSQQSCLRIKSSDRDLRKHANSLGLKRLLNSLDNEQIEEQSSLSGTKNLTSSSNSIDIQKSYIKIQRPRTQSQSQYNSKRRK